MIKLQNILIVIAVFQQWMFAWSAWLCKEGEYYDDVFEMCISCFLCSNYHLKSVVEVKCAKNSSDCGGCEDGYEKGLTIMCSKVVPALTAESNKNTSYIAVMIDVHDGGLSAGAIVGIVIGCLLVIGIGIIIILYRCNLLPGQKRRHNIPSDLHSESEKGSIHTSERESFVDSDDVEESSQLGSLRSYLPSVGLGPLPPHRGSQPYSHSAADAWSTHYQASLRSSGSGSHLPLQAQSTGPSSPIHAQPDTQPTPDFIRTLPYPMQDSAAHETEPKTA